MKIKTQKQFYFIFAIISLLIAGIVTFFVKQNNLPFEFRLDKKELIGENKAIYIYDDLDNDDYSETIFLTKFHNTTNYAIQINNSNDAIIDQFNLFSRTKSYWLKTIDYNNDNYKDIFVFSQLEDSLFLSVIDVKARQFILKRQFIMLKPDSAKHKEWDIEAVPVGLLNVDNDISKELIFYIKGGYTIYPRTVYSYDIEKKIIINKFEIGNSLHSLLLTDIDFDGEKEIIVSTIATGNMPKKIGYHDHTNWLIVLNKYLVPIFSPKRFGKYPGSSYTIPFKKGNKNYLLATYQIQNEKGRSSKTLIFNTKGELIDSIKNLDGEFGRPIKMIEDGEEVIYGLNYNSIFKVNNKLKVQEKLIVVGEYNISSRKIIYNLPFQETILFNNIQQIFLTNKNLDLLASYNFEEKIFTDHYSTIKKNGENKLPQLLIPGEKNNYLFTIVGNKVYSYLPLISLCTILLSFFFFIGLHKILSFLSTYTKYFGYSLKKSSKGIVLLNSNGNLFYSNIKMDRYLKINSISAKGESYKNVFNGKSDILSSIENSLNTQEIVKKELHISKADYEFEGSLTITPFTSFIGYTYAYLMEVSDFTEPLLTDRGKVWGATLQRIAHEIKTPLSTLILSLDNLKNRLVGKDIDVNDEIIMMQSELGRIKQLTKNFMMFTNLEQQTFDKISLSKILNESINVFSSYFKKTIALKFIYNDFYVFADERQLSQLFPLLIENAIDACDGKGIIEIRCEALGLRQKTYDDNSKGEYIKITIRDNGNGMSDEILQKIFEPYFTTKKDGTGMGLSLAKKITEDNRGRLEINSTEGSGTEVMVYLQTVK